MNRPGIFVLLLLLLAVPAQSALGQHGRVTGLTLDSSGLALPGVNVRVAGTLLGAASDVDGRFTLPRVPAGTQTLLASAVGYLPTSIDVEVSSSATAEVTMVLEETVLSSGEVVVTASRRLQATVDVPASVSVLRPSDLELRNIVSLDEALRFIPGVHVQENQVNIRGSSGYAYNTGSRVLMLLDGIPLLTPETDGIPFEALPFAQIERIEVLKGPGSALYGSGALGGVVNVITKPFPETPETLISGFSGAYDPVRYATWRDAWTGADEFREFWGLTFSHARRLGDRLGMWVDVAYRRDEGYLNYSTSRTLQAYGKVGWQPRSNLRTEMLLGVMLRKKDNFLFWNGGRDALNPGSLAIGGGSGPTGTNDVFGNQFSVMPSLTHLLAPNLFYSVKARLFATVIRPIDEFGHGQPLSYGTVGFRYGGETQLTWEPAPNRHVTVGASGDALATRSNFYVTSNGDETGSQPEGAIFAQIEDRVFGLVDVAGGLRFDTYSIDAVQTIRRLSPRLSAAVHLDDATVLRAAFGHGFRVPSLAERFTENRDYFPIARNLELEPERSQSFELGLRLERPGPLNGLVQFDVAAFLNNYTALIEPRLVPALSAFQFVNLTRAQIKGVEAAIDWRAPGERATVRLGYTYLDTEDLDSGLPLAFRSKHQLTGSVDTRPFSMIEAGFDVRLISKAERVDSDFAKFVRDADILVPVRIVDLRLGIRSGAFRVSLLLHNAFDYYYLERPAFLGPPRRLTLRAQVRF